MRVYAILLCFCGSILGAVNTGYPLGFMSDCEFLLRIHNLHGLVFIS